MERPAGAVLLLLAILQWTTREINGLPTTSNQHPVEDASFWNKKAQDALAKRLSINPANTNTGAKNVIVFIGDGMGIAPTVAARIYKGQMEGSPFGGEEAEFAWEQFPYAAFSKTYNTDYQVADSAGTATAIFSGSKTRMAVLGIDGTVPYNSCDPDLVERSKLKTMLHKAIEDGKDTGIVTTARITHATPGALYSHIQNRDWETDSQIPPAFSACKDIAYQLVNSEAGKKLNVIMGGGLGAFKPQIEGGKRLDGNLVTKWSEGRQERGESGAVLLNTKDLRKWSEDYTDFAIGLFQDGHMSFEADRNTSDEGEPSLSEMTKVTLKRLQRSKKGFFLMVEGGLIDVAHHKNNAKRAFEETLEFERAIKAALSMINLEETLVIVTADHSHALTINGYPKRGNPILGSVFEPPRKNFLTQPDGHMSPYTTLSYANGPGFHKHFTGNGQRPWKDVSKDFEFPIEDDINFLQPSLWRGPDDYETHGGEDVGIFATGPMSHLFIGVHEQNYIAHVVDHAVNAWKKGQRGPKTSSGVKVESGLILCLALGITNFIISQKYMF